MDVRRGSGAARAGAPVAGTPIGAPPQPTTSDGRTALEARPSSSPHERASFERQPASRPATGATAGGQTPVPARAGRATALSVRLTRAVEPPFGGPTFDARLDQATASVARGGVQVKMLFDGVNSFPERHRLIDEAASSIHLQTFIFNDDEAGWTLARKLADAARRGVDVRVIVDKLGSARAGDGIFDHMRSAGVEVRFYDTGLNPLKVNERWHEKHLIVDGKVSIQGGMNIANEYALGGSGKALLKTDRTSSEPWRDTDVRIEGPAVQDAQRAFVSNWRRVGGEIAADKRAALFPKPTHEAHGAEVRVVQHHPAEGHDRTMALYTAAIGAATKSIRIENAYFVPPPELREALIAAARRGVDIRILTNSKESSDMGFVVDAARYWYDELLEAGVKIFEVQGGTLHSKTASFDGAYALVGSANLNGRSKSLDGEVILAIRDDTVAREVDARFDSGAARAREITAAAVAQDSFVTNLKQWAMSTVSWTL